mgnify:CR=1
MGQNIITQIAKEMTQEKEMALKAGDTEKDLTMYSKSYCEDHHEYNASSFSPVEYQV